MPIPDHVAAKFDHIIRAAEREQLGVIETSDGHFVLAAIATDLTITPLGYISDERPQHPTSH